MTENYCQSCAMPMETEDLYGTNADGSKNSDYCKYCYDKGAFTAHCTMEEMIDFCVPVMVEHGQKEEEARKMMEECLPQLKRWKKS